MGALRNHFMNLYPYTDFHELNADWMIKMLMKMVDEVENFVAQNAIKYADPIQWDITHQYEKNTIVVDPITGTAYLSNRPVPMGIALSNTHYWSVVFDLGRFITLASQNFANTYEAVLTTTATQPTDEGGWVVWNSILYQAKNDIHVGDAYVVDGNIEKRTVEDFFNDLKTSLASEAQTRADEDARIELELSDLVASQITFVNGRIDDEAQTRADEDTRIELELTDLITSKVDVEAQSRADEDARIELELRDLISSQVNIINGKIGDLDDLTTINKDNVVGAINELNSQISGLYDKADIRSYGGGTDKSAAENTAALNAALADNNVVYLPNYNNVPYELNAVTLTKGQSIIGDEGTTINTTATDFITITDSNTDVKNIIVNTSGNVIYIDSSAHAFSFIHIENVYSYGANRFIYDNTSASYQYTNLYINRCAARQHKSYGVDLTKAFAFVIMEDVTIDCVGQTGINACFRLTDNAGAQLTRCEAEGGFTDGSHVGHGGFVFSNCQAIWLTRCMADTVDSVGYNFTNTQFVYMLSCVSSLCGSHGIAILSSTCKNFLITNCIFAGRKGQMIAPPSAIGIYNFNDYIQFNNCEVYNFTGTAIADGSSSSHNIYASINIDNCLESFRAPSAGGMINSIISTIADVPIFGYMIYRQCMFNNVLYDKPLGQ